jgi:hypothetical protein
MAKISINFFVPMGTYNSRVCGGKTRSSIQIHIASRIL